MQDSRKPDPQIDIVDNPAEPRFEIHVDGALAGFVTYRDLSGIRTFRHTEIDPAYEGMGLASKLTRFVLDEARASARRVHPVCPFVRSYIGRHPEYLDLVDKPERFGLSR